MSHLLIFNFTDFRVLCYEWHISHQPSRKSFVTHAWPNSCSQSAAVPLTAGQSRSDVTATSSSDTTKPQRPSTLFTPPPRENPRAYRLLSAKRKKKLPENRLLSWRRGQPFIKMSNDLWSLTLDRMTFLLGLSGALLCVRGSWKLSLEAHKPRWGPTNMQSTKSLNWWTAVEQWDGKIYLNNYRNEGENFAKTCVTTIGDLQNSFWNCFNGS